MSNSQQPRYMNDENELNEHFIAEVPLKKSFWEALKKFFTCPDLTLEEWERLEQRRHYRGCGMHHRDLWRL